MAESIIEIAKRLRAERERAAQEAEQERLLEASKRGLVALDALDKFRPDLVEACKLAGIEISGEGGAHPLFGTIWFSYYKNRVSASIRLENGDMELPLPKYNKNHQHWTLEAWAETLYEVIVEPYEVEQAKREGGQQ